MNKEKLDMSERADLFQSLLTNLKQEAFTHFDQAVEFIEKKSQSPKIDSKRSFEENLQKRLDMQFIEIKDKLRSLSTQSCLKDLKLDEFKEEHLKIQKEIESMIAVLLTLSLAATLFSLVTLAFRMAGH